MQRALILVVMLCLAAASTGVGPARAAESGCAGSWLVHISLEGRDVVEDALMAFGPDGAIVVYSPPVLPALPGPGEEPLQASTGLGVWQSTAERKCAFEFVRLLAADDGVGVGTLNVRGMAAVDTAGDQLAGTLTYTRSTGFGQTAATASGTFTGTPLDGPLLWLTPDA